MDGTPREVFSQREDLEMIGLTVPAVTAVLYDLKKKGLPVRTDRITVEEARDEILRVLGR